MILTLGVFSIVFVNEASTKPHFFGPNCFFRVSHNPLSRFPNVLGRRTHSKHLSAGLFCLFLGRRFNGLLIPTEGAVHRLRTAPTSRSSSSFSDSESLGGLTADSEISDQSLTKRAARNSKTTTRHRPKQSDMSPKSNKASKIFITNLRVYIATQNAFGDQAAFEVPLLPVSCLEIY
jgi:hypothetical protein